MVSALSHSSLILPVRFLYNFGNTYCASTTLRNIPSMKIERFMNYPIGLNNHTKSTGIKFINSVSQHAQDIATPMVVDR